MIITPRNLLSYLQTRGLIDLASVVEGDFMVVDASRRNRNMKVIRKRYPSYFVKQVQQWDPQSIITMQREAACYAILHQHADFARVASFVPAYYGFDSERHILIVSLVPDGENMAEYHQRLGRFPTPVAAALGTALGTYHQLGDVLTTDTYNSVFPRSIPWILAAHQSPSSAFIAQGHAPAQVVAIVQHYPEFSQALDQLRGQWQMTSLIHGDIKWDNCIVSPRSAPDEAVQLTIVDWEIADYGDAYWDCGAVFHTYLTAWVLSMPTTGAASASEMVARAQRPIEQMQPAMRAFWHAYVETRRLDAAVTKQALQRSVQYAAARMVQTAFEAMARSPQVSANILYLLQVSFNILHNVEEAIGELVGL